MRISLPPKEGGFVGIRAVYLLSDNRLAFESLRDLDRTCLFEPREIAHQPRFVWENLSARTDLRCGARPGNKGLVI
jgi:hypothetical protein